MCRAEQVFDGPVDHASGTQDHTGTKRGPYKLGGLSECHVQALKAEQRKLHAKGQLSNADLAAVLALIKQQRSKIAAPKKSILAFF